MEVINNENDKNYKN